MSAARVGLLAAALALVGLVGPAAGPAAAACHAFGVSVAPGSPTEGANVTATITRDGSVGDSSVRLRTVDGTAKAGQDYDAVDTRVRFTAGTSTTVTISTRQDTAHEPTETFTLHLSEGDGCNVNPNFSYGGPVTVSIQDDDPAAPAPDTTASSLPESTTTTDATVDGEQAASTGDDDDPPWLAVAVAVVALGGVGGYLAYRRRAVS